MIHVFALGKIACKGLLRELLFLCYLFFVRMERSLWFRAGAFPAIWLFLAVAAQAAEIRVFSDLTRVGPNGMVLEIDRGRATKPREILSPAAVRNGFTSFHVFIDAAPTEPWTLYVGQNPDKSASVDLYRVEFEGSTPVRFIHSEQPIEGTGPAVVWLDLFLAKDAPVDRIKIEPQLQTAGRSDWIVYPMEVRVVDARVPGAKRTPMDSGAGPNAAADSGAIRILARQLCAGQQPEAQRSLRDPLNPQGFLHRNFLQDLSLMRFPDDADWLWLMTKAPDRKAWCKNPVRPPDASAEWYLRIRDRLLLR
ncbi:MAG: hypothetical protein ABI823_10080 [Bryobacteraceae bacterium]